MTNAELLDLLREARDSVERDMDYTEIPDQVSREHQRLLNLRARIDAALAEGCPDCGHQYGQQEYCQGDGHAEHAESATPVVEWIDYGEWGAKSTQIDGFALTVRAHGLPGPWHWEAPRCSGYAATKDEAKSAAIAAARGMR